MLLYLIWVELIPSSRNKKSSKSRSKTNNTNSKAAVHTRHHRSGGCKTIKSTRFSVGFRGISRLGFAFIFMRLFKLKHICIQVTSLHRWNKQGTNRKLLTGNQFHVTLRIVSSYILCKWSDLRHLPILFKDCSIEATRQPMLQCLETLKAVYITSKILWMHFSKIVHALAAWTWCC